MESPLAGGRTKRVGKTGPRPEMRAAKQLGTWVVVKNNRARPVGSYHVPVFGYPIWVLGIYNHKFGYPKNRNMV